MIDIEYVDVLGGSESIDDPVIIIDAAMARRAIALGETEAVFRQGVGALDLSGKTVVFLKEVRDAE